MRAHETCRCRESECALVSNEDSGPRALRCCRSSGASTHLDKAAVLSIELQQRLSSVDHSLLQLVDRDFGATLDLPRGALDPRVCPVEIAVGCHDAFGRHARRALERVDVLRVAAPENAAIGQQADKVVRGRWCVLSRPHGSSEPIEGRRIAEKEVQVEDGLREGQAVLLQL